MPRPVVAVGGDHVVVAAGPGDPDPWVGGLDAWVVPYAFAFVTAGGAVVAGSFTPPLEAVAVSEYRGWSASPYPTSYPVFDLEFRVGGQQYTGADVLGYPRAVFQGGVLKGVEFDTGDGFPGGRVRAGVDGGGMFAQVGGQPAVLAAPAKPKHPDEGGNPRPAHPPMVTLDVWAGDNEFTLDFVMETTSGVRPPPLLVPTTFKSKTAAQAVEHLLKELEQAGFKAVRADGNQGRSTVYILGKLKPDGTTDQVRELKYKVTSPIGRLPGLAPLNGADAGPRP